MKYIYKVRVLILLLLAFKSLGQDIHFSQFYNAPFDLNPALTGVFGGDMRFSSNYRNQWSSVPVAFQTLNVAYDQNFANKGMDRSFFAGGLIFQHDIAGISKLTRTKIGVSGSYTKRFSPKVFVSVGSQATFNHRTFNFSKLTFDNQYDPLLGVYDPNTGSGENFPTTNNNFFGLSAGINIRIQQRDREGLIDRLEERNKIDFGVGLFHINQPDQRFLEEGAPLPLAVRVNPYVLGTLMLGGDFDLLGNLSVQFQGPFHETIAGIGGKLHLSKKPGNQVSLQLGFNIRFFDASDALFPAVQLNYNNWKVGFSYDSTISDFNAANKGRGGPEFSIQYIIRKVPPVPEFKICPLI